jgi:serine/threonine-protein kinase
MAAPPARQSFGVPADGTGPMATEQYRPATNNTLIVSGADASYGGTAYGGTAYGSAAYGTEPGGYPAVREPRLQRLLFSRRLGYVALGVVAILAASLLGWYLFSGRYTTVPPVAGVATATAQAELHNVGLTGVAGKTEFDNTVAKGLVIRTIPGSGARLAKGGKVTLIVSAGPHMITMPQVTGQQLAAAQAAIKHAGLTPGKVSLTPSATIGAGIVISTSPAAGTSWPQPKPVAITESAGPPLPDFVGQPKTVAEAWAQANGVQLDEVTANHSDQPAGTVIKQSLKAGSAFTKGQVITIDISPGPPMVAIPSVTGLKVGQAVRILKHLGFVVQFQPTGPFNVVDSYSPTGQAPKGSTITLVIGFPHFGG